MNAIGAAVFFFCWIGGVTAVVFGAILVGFALGPVVGIAAGILALSALFGFLVWLEEQGP